MKKILFLIVICIIPMLTFFGCGQVDCISLIEKNMSERSDVYFYSDGDDMQISICSGQREEPYAYDGVSNQKLDFALITAEIDSTEPEIIMIEIDDQNEEVLLEYNYLTGKHMADLERKLSGEEYIKIFYLDKEISMVCKSNDFQISSKEAIKLGFNALNAIIEPLCDGDIFNGECYLKILDKLSGDFNDIFWLFSVLDKDGNINNVIISTNEPYVFADNQNNMI